MSARRTLRVCSDCGTEIREEDALIEYEASGGTVGYAECPGCEAVVKVRL